MLTVGVDIGGTSVRAGVVDRRGTILDTARVGTPSGADALYDAIVSVVSSSRPATRSARWAWPWPGSWPRT
ncbi:hypothetical protein GCM10029964_023280 [Kibdelosporangium lantanae]